MSKLMLFFVFAVAIAADANGLAGPKSDLQSCKLETKKIETTELKTEGFTYNAGDKGSPLEEGDNLFCEDEDSDGEESNLKPQHRVCNLHETCELKPNEGNEHNTIIRAKGSKYDNTAFSETLRERYRSSEINETNNSSYVDSDKNATPRATWKHGKTDNDDNDISEEDIEENIEEDNCPWLFSERFFHIAPKFKRVSEFFCGPKRIEDKIIVFLIIFIGSKAVEAFLLWLYTTTIAVEHYLILERKWRSKVIKADPKQIAPKIKVISKKLTKLYKRVIELNKELEALEALE